MKTAILALSLFSTSFAFAAEATIGASGCLVVNSRPVPKETVKWSGPCKDGYADGAGTLDWFIGGALTLHFEGTLKHGRKHGDGYTRDAAMTHYEGGFLEGKRHGKGIRQLVDHTRYEGEWKDGQEDGKGAIKYSTGGQYEGQWKAGQFHGSGKATYTSGKVVEGEFREGVPVGQPVVKELHEDKKYSLSNNEMQHGSKVGFQKIVLGSVPFQKTWDAMSKDDQRRIRQMYPLLHEEDEPPYPANGTAKLYRAISAGQSKILTTGALRMNVLVDSTGTPSTVTVFASPDPATTKFATFVVMTEKYKPALCAGTPCPMIFPFSMTFSVE